MLTNLGLLAVGALGDSAEGRDAAVRREDRELALRPEGQREDDVDRGPADLMGSENLINWLPVFPCAFTAVHCRSLHQNGALFSTAHRSESANKVQRP